MNAFSHLEASQYADSIYYADLFKINGKTWMIAGCGKSKAALLATNYDRAADIARDAVAIIRNEDGLYGRYDPGAIHKDIREDNGLSDFHKLDIIAYCLNETQSKDYNKSALIQTNYDTVALLLGESTYPAFLAPNFFSIEKYSWLCHSFRRLTRFVELTSPLSDTKFLLVPWMATLEDKALLYSSFEISSMAEEKCL